MPGRLRLLTIAGSDSGGGAGLQADLKTFAAHGAFGMSAVTAVTAQNTVEVRSVEVMSPDLVADQIAAVLEDIGVDGIKIGMLGNAGVVEAVARSLEVVEDGVPVVLDPVMVSKSGATLLPPDAISALRSRLLPLSTLVTPNLPEATILGGTPPSSTRKDLVKAMKSLGPPVLLKGGHGGGAYVQDVLIMGAGSEVIRHPRQQTRNTHGTGCTLAAAIVVRLAGGDDLSSAVRGGIRYVQEAMAAALDLGRGHGPLDHLEPEVYRG